MFYGPADGTPDGASVAVQLAERDETQVRLVVGARLSKLSIKKTGKTLGFVSPLLYKMYAADKSIFHDITVGDNKCTEGGCSPGCQGYVAAAGWGFQPKVGAASRLLARKARRGEEGIVDGVYEEGWHHDPFQQRP